MRTILILNPTSGISTVSEKRMSPEETERTILVGLRSSGIEPEVYHTTPTETGRGLARRAAEDGAELVIAAGGDGTIHAVANGLIGTRSILGIIPTGTMNNLAHSLNVPETIPAACTAIANGETRAVDVGKINAHIFIEVAGIGLEASLFPAAEEIKSPGFLSTVRGAVHGLYTLLTFKPTSLRLTLDQADTRENDSQDMQYSQGHQEKRNSRRQRTYTALQITISNAPYYGAHLQVASDVLMDDGWLDVVIYSNFSKLEYLQHAISISQGRRPYQPKIRRLRVQKMRIDAAQPMAIQADGEQVGRTPATLTMLPKALRVRVSGQPAPGLNDGQQSRQPTSVSKPITSSREE